MSDIARTAFYNALREDYSSFIARSVETVHPGAEYVSNWHIDAIAEKLEACRTGAIKRLIINMPPRMLKSTCVSVAWPAFLLGKNPAERIVVASYASSLSVKHSLDSRLILQSDWYQEIFPRTRIAAGENEKHKFVMTERGFRYAVSVGGAVTGEGGNFLIVDDPHNPVQAAGARTRSIANRWFDNTFMTRLDDKHKGVIVLVMQRLHEEDLTGHLLAKGGWEQLLLPAIAPEDTYVHLHGLTFLRKAGDPLHPKREDALMIERMKRDLGSAVFAAQYQQNPLSDKESMVKLDWFMRYRNLPAAEAVLRIIQSWDTAIKAQEKHDATACITIAETKERLFVLEVAVWRVEYPELKRAVLSQAAKWKPHAILIEDKASGQSLLQDLRRETSLPCIPMQPLGDKVMRMAAISPIIEAGRVALPQQASWLPEFESELCRFPHAAHDDQVDALSQCLHWIRRREGNEPMLRTL